MPEQETKVQAVQVYYTCDACGQAVLEHSKDTVLLTNPPRYRYVCPSCGHRQTLPANYPYVRHKPIGDER